MTDNEALREWLDKTEWVQKTATAQELGKHRADVLRLRIEALEAQLEAVGAGGVQPLRPAPAAHVEPIYADLPEDSIGPFDVTETEEGDEYYDHMGECWMDAKEHGVRLYTEAHLRAFADATHALRVSAQQRTLSGLESDADAQKPPARLYLCGPMTGLPEFNYPAFHAAAAELRACGFTVVNPAESGLPADAPWHQHMRVNLKAMMDCDGVALLPGWQASKGATLEVDLALELSMPVRRKLYWLVHGPLGAYLPQRKTGAEA
ncbi:MAG: DUF4406 domain-containing protein [Burkholderiaceae bacterium]